MANKKKIEKAERKLVQQHCKGRGACYNIQTPGGK